MCVRKALCCRFSLAVLFLFFFFFSFFLPCYFPLLWISCQLFGFTAKFQAKNALRFTAKPRLWPRSCLCVRQCVWHKVFHVVNGPVYMFFLPLLHAVLPLLRFILSFPSAGKTRALLSLICFHCADIVRYIYANICSCISINMPCGRLSESSIPCSQSWGLDWANRN